MCLLPGPQVLLGTKRNLPGRAPGLPEQGQALDFVQAQDVTPSCHHLFWCHSFWFRYCFPSVSYNSLFHCLYLSKWIDTARQPSTRSPSPPALHQLQLLPCQGQSRYLLPSVPSPPHFSTNKSEDIKVPACRFVYAGIGTMLDKLVGRGILSQMGKGNTAWLGFGLITFDL